MTDAVEFFIHFIFCRKFFNFITLNFVSLYLGVLRDGNPVAGLQMFEWIRVEWIKHFFVIFKNNFPASSQATSLEVTSYVWK